MINVFNKSSTEELLEEFEQVIDARTELYEKMFNNGDKIEGSDSLGDVYISDMIDAADQNVLDLAFEIVKRKAQIIKNKSEILK